MRRKKGFAKGQYHLYSDKGMISLIEPAMHTMNMWEIYSLDGDLFEDIERFETELEAEKRCEELLGK